MKELIKKIVLNLTNSHILFHEDAHIFLNLLLNYSNESAIHYMNDIKFMMQNPNFNHQLSFKYQIQNFRETVHEDFLKVQYRVLIQFWEKLLKVSKLCY